MSSLLGNKPPTANHSAGPLVIVGAPVPVRKERPMRATSPALSFPIAVCICLGSLALSGAAAPKRERARSYQGFAVSLSVSDRAGKAGEPMEVTVTLAAGTDTHRLFNP